jgi:hypothetical protein
MKASFRVKPFYPDSHLFLRAVLKLEPGQSRNRASQYAVSMIAKQRPAQACEGMLGGDPPFYQDLRSNYGIRIVL